MRIVIAGAGSVGTFMAQQLATEGHEVLLLDNDPDVEHRVQALDSVAFVAGDACDVEVLARAEVGRADVLAAVTGDDEDNLVISLLAKQEFAVPRVAARVNNPKNEWMFNQMWGVDVSVSTPHLLTALVEEAVTVGSFVRLMHFERGRANLWEITLDESSSPVGSVIGSLSWPKGSTPVAVVRDGHVMGPSPDLSLRSGDELLVLVGTDVENEVRALLAGRLGSE